MAVAAIVGGTFLVQKGANPVENTNVGDVAGTTDSSAKTFSGTVSAVDTGCFVDAVCSVTIDGKKVILVEGGLSLSPSPVVGKLVGVDSIGDIQDRIGAFANVYAGVTPEGDYTLYGNSDYYVEITTTSDK